MAGLYKDPPYPPDVQPRVHTTIRDYTQGGPSTSGLPSAKEQPVASSVASAVHHGTGFHSMDYTQGGPSTNGPRSKQSVADRTAATPIDRRIIIVECNKRPASETLPRSDVTLPYNVSRVSQKHNKKFNANSTDYSISFEPVSRNEPLIGMMPRVSGIFMMRL